MDRKFGPSWHCIVGKGFGSSVTYMNNNFLFLYICNKAIMIFRHWSYLFTLIHEIPIYKSVIASIATIFQKPDYQDNQNQHKSHSISPPIFSWNHLFYYSIRSIHDLRHLPHLLCTSSHFFCLAMQICTDFLRNTLHVIQ